MYLFNRYSLLMFKVICLIAYLAIAYLAQLNKIILPFYIDLTFLFIFLDFKNILALKNYFAIYAFLIFKISTLFWFPDNYSLTFDGTLYISSFLLGYEMKKCFSSKGTETTSAIKPDYDTYTNKLLYLIKIFIVLKILYALFLISQYGFSAFYSGRMLAEKVGQYGRQSTLDGILTIYSSFVNTFLIALSVLYVKYCSAQNKLPNYYWLTVVFLLMPLLILSRSTFAFGILTMLSIYGYFSKNMAKVYLYLIPVFIVLFTVSIYIGTLRMNSYESGEDFSSVTSEDHVVTELTPIVAYNGVKENIKTLKHQYGKTIILPLLFKPIPRSWWPTKPNNSGALYMREFDPGSFYAGFMIPLSIFGDLYFNFGVAVACFIIILIGVMIARFDLIYINKDFKHIDTYFILFNCFYSFVRDDLPEALISILLLVFAAKVIDIFILKAQQKTAIPQIS
jgi:oligosaccharide repeat unit polymerase